MTTSKCKSCSADIVWVTLPSGATMPLDARTLTLYVIDPEGAQGSSPRAKPIQVRASHFASCPNANDWRRKP